MATQAEDITAIRAYVTAWFWINIIAGILGLLVSAWGTMAVRSTIKATP